MTCLETVVIALGGNAILRRGTKGTPGEQWETVKAAAREIARIASNGSRVVVTHGNGPQVGYLLEAFESLPRDKPRQSLDLAVAMTQGWLGFLIAHSIEREAETLGVEAKTAVIVTRVMVSRRDPSFENPSKYIGSYYTEEEAKRLEEQYGWVMKRDPRGMYRRVVPSPTPLRILEADRIKQLVENNYIAVAVGGGGIPVDEDLQPVEAVIDKDLASSLLARSINADRFIILTDVKGVAVNYGKPDEEWLTTVTVSQLEEYYAQGHFPPGSMGPKVKAAIDFVKETGGTASIGDLQEAYKVYRRESGTHIIPDKP